MTNRTEPSGTKPYHTWPALPHRTSTCQPNRACQTSPHLTAPYRTTQCRTVPAIHSCQARPYPARAFPDPSRPSPACQTEPYRTSPHHATHTFPQLACLAGTHRTRTYLYIPSRACHTEPHRTKPVVPTAPDRACQAWPIHTRPCSAQPCLAKSYWCNFSSAVF